MPTDKHPFGGQHEQPTQCAFHLRYCRSCGNPEFGNAIDQRGRRTVTCQDGEGFHWWLRGFESSAEYRLALGGRVCEAL